MIGKFKGLTDNTYSKVGTVRYLISVRIRISPYSVRMREIVTQNNSEYGHFLRGGIFKYPKKHASLKTKLLRFNSIAFLTEEL